MEIISFSELIAKISDAL